MRKAPKGSTMHPLDERINRIIAMVKAKGGSRYWCRTEE
jgi:IS5 family transposase